MSHHLQRSEQEVQQLLGGGVGDVAAQPGLRVGEVLVFVDRCDSLFLSPPEAPRWVRAHQQAEGVLDFLKHVGVLGP